jgi:hypothetical protein
VSRSVDLFISSAEPVDELASAVAGRAGLTLDADPGDDPGRVVLRDGDLAAVLHEHTFVDDGDLVLRRYRYALSLRSTATGHLGLSPETAFLRRVADVLDDVPVLLVLDLQYRAEADERPR